jgi:GH15 family glucan-1,4-alpha-glucosidase
MAAARFSEVLDKRNHMREFAAAAAAVKEATLKYLYDSELGAFVRTAIVQNGQLVLDRTVDSSSLFGLWYFGMLDQSDPLFQSTLLQTQQRLTNPGQVGGFIRYEHDRYFRSGELPNPWFITTLWDAQRRLSQPEVSSADLDAVKHTLEWVTKYLSPSGVLAEQLGENAELLSATPLVWSHAVWIETVLQYIKVLEARGECPDCNNRQ